MPVYTNPLIDQEPNSKIVFYLDNKCAIFTCNASPEGVILANTGSIALSDNGSVYKKTTDDVNTGWIELQSGTAASPLEIVGATPTLNFDDTDVSGQTGQITVENGTPIIFYASGQISNFPKNLVNNAVPVGNVGAGTDPLMSFSVGAELLRTDGDSLRIYACGNASAQDGGAGDQRVFNWTYGGQAIDSRTIQATNAICAWEVQITITRLSAVSARYVSRYSAWNTAAGTTTIGAFVTQGTIAVTHANANTIAFTASSTDAVNNDCTQNLLSVDLIQQ